MSHAPNEQLGSKEINTSHFRVSHRHELCTWPFQSLWQIKTCTLVAADTDESNTEMDVD